jgi:hypothetical protein
LERKEETHVLHFLAQRPAHLAIPAAGKAHGGLESRP